jgi:acetyl esterase/lipase
MVMDRQRCRPQRIMGLPMIYALRLAAFIALCAASTAPADAYQVKMQTNVAYGPNSAHRLDYCTPVGLAGTRRGILLFHGGGFVQGDKRDMTGLCQKLAAQGFVVANANYRLAAKVPTGDAAIKPISDAQLALRYFRSRAAAMAMDATKICTYGWSAGGGLAALLGIHASALGDMAAIVPDYSSKAHCSVLVGGVVDNRDPAYTVVDLADANTAPAYLVTGTLDTLSTPAMNMAYDQRLTSLGVVHELDIYSGGHVWRNATSATRNRIEADIVTWLRAR